MNAPFPSSPPDENAEAPSAMPGRAHAAYTEEDDRVAGLLGFHPALAVRPGVCFAYADRWRGAAVAAAGFAGSFAILVLALLLYPNLGRAQTLDERAMIAAIAMLDGWAGSSLEAVGRHLTRSIPLVLLLLIVMFAVQWGWAYALARSVRRLTGWRGWPWFAAAPLVFNGIAHAFSSEASPFHLVNGRVPAPFRAAAWSALGLLVVLEIVGRLRSRVRSRSGR